MSQPVPPLAKPLALTDSEYDAVMKACAPLQPHQRSGFLEELAAELRGLPELGDGRIYRAIAKIQRRHFDAPDLRISGGGKHR
jgi:hypothetical protein